MDTVAAGALIVLALVAFNNYKNQTLPQWLRAKFFNQIPGGATPQSATGAGTIGLIPQAAPSSGLGGGAGIMQAPVSGPVTSPFGPRNGRLHEGIDFGVPVGTTVRAARAGKVISAGGAGGYGLKVDVDHGEGVVTRYAHMSRIDVRLGQTVAGGAALGLSGNTGESTGPHVHFEVRRNGVAVNPAPFLSYAGLGASVSA